ncbi:MAG: hypothetical protein JSS09_03875, partial [Verrucomicrobia bacterium]|nr:hypothetical protein [Verrucomicrobiota bacterium]
ILDVSNIPDYVLINLRSNQIDFEPKIISTNQDCRETEYKTYQHKNMSKEKKEELRELLQLLDKWLDQRCPTWTKRLAMYVKGSFCMESFLTYYSDELLTALKKSMAIKTRPKNPSDLRFLAINNWNKLSPQEIKEWNDVLQKHPGNESFLIE